MIITLATLAILYYLRHKVKSIWNKGQCKYIIGSFVIFVFSIYFLVSNLRTHPPKVADIQLVKKDPSPVTFHPSKSPSRTSLRLRQLQLPDLDTPPKSSECLLPVLDVFENLNRSTEASEEFDDCKAARPFKFWIKNNVPIPKLESAYKTSSWTACYYRYGYRLDNDSISLGNQSNKINLDFTTNRLQEMPDHSSPYNIIGIECKRAGSNDSSKVELVDVLDFVQKKSNVERRINKTILSQNKERRRQRRINVQLIVLDSVSQIQFLKSFGQTHKYIVGTLSGIDFHGLSIAEDSKEFYQSITSLLTGKNFSNLESMGNNRSYIWQHFSSIGYYTAIAENCPGLFSSLRLKTNGSRRSTPQPTDYYSRDFPRQVSKNINNDFENDKADRCYGPSHSFDSLLDYWYQLADFTKNQTDSMKNYFLFLSSCKISINNVHVGQGNDRVLLNHMKLLQEENFLNDSAVFIIGNHGPRLNAFGRTEEIFYKHRMPVSYLILPKWFRTEYKFAVDNLLENRKVLTTHYDTYETIMDLLDLGNINQISIDTRTKMLQTNWENGKFSTAISLFLPIPKDRDCQVAKIDMNVCPCPSHEMEIPSVNENLQSSVGQAIQNMNDKIMAIPKWGRSFFNFTR